MFTKRVMTCNRILTAFSFVSARIITWKSPGEAEWYTIHPASARHFKPPPYSAQEVRNRCWSKLRIVNSGLEINENQSEYVKAIKARVLLFVINHAYMFILCPVLYGYTDFVHIKVRSDVLAEIKYSLLFVLTVVSIASDCSYWAMYLCVLYLSWSHSHTETEKQYLPYRAYDKAVLDHFC
jgi:hypothetical protein